MREKNTHRLTHIHASRLRRIFVQSELLFSALFHQYFAIIDEPATAAAPPKSIENEIGESAIAVCRPSI